MVSNVKRDEIAESLIWFIGFHGLNRQQLETKLHFPLIEGPTLETPAVICFGQ